MCPCGRLYQTGDSLITPASRRFRQSHADATSAMLSAKLLLCDTCLIILVALAFAIPEDKTVGNTVAGAADAESVKGNCSCGGFPTKAPAPAVEPLLSQSPGLVVGCGAEGDATCRSLCVALATATKAKGPEILCHRLKDCVQLELSVFYKICDGPWVYADMTADEPLCCENSKPKDCANTTISITNGPSQ